MFCYSVVNLLRIVIHYSEYSKSVQNAVIHYIFGSESLRIVNSLQIVNSLRVLFLVCRGPLGKQIEKSKDWRVSVALGELAPAFRGIRECLRFSPRRPLLMGHTPQHGWDFPEEIPEEFRKDPGNALRAFPEIQSPPKGAGHLVPRENCRTVSKNIFDDF